MLTWISFQCHGVLKVLTMSLPPTSLKLFRFVNESPFDIECLLLIFKSKTYNKTYFNECFNLS